MAVLPYINNQLCLIYSPMYFSGYTLLSIVIFKYFRDKEITVSKKRPLIKLNFRYLISSLFLLVFNIMMIDLGYSLIGLIITFIFIAIAIDPRIILRIDYILILIFAMMFIVFGELSIYLKSINIIVSHNYFGIFLHSIILSQLISNVPATIVLIKHIHDWIPLLWGVNVGGVGIIIGSMANIIVLRLFNISLRAFHKYQLIYFFLFTLITAFLLWIYYSFI